MVWIMLAALALVSSHFSIFAPLTLVRLAFRQVQPGRAAINLETARRCCQRRRAAFDAHSLAPLMKAGRTEKSPFVAFIYPEMLLAHLLPLPV